MKGVPIVIVAFLSSLVIHSLFRAGRPGDLQDGVHARNDGIHHELLHHFPVRRFLGKIVELSGAAETIARTITGKPSAEFVAPGVIIAAAILTMGGVSVYVALFALQYPFP